MLNNPATEEPYQVHRARTILVTIGIGYILFFIFSAILPEFWSRTFFGELGQKQLFQFFMWLPFFIGVGILQINLFLVNKAKEHLEQNYFPFPADAMISKTDIGTVYQRVKSQRDEMAYLPKLTRLCILQYQSTKSIDHITNILTTQLELLFHRIELRFSTVKFLAWLIPSIGFMGTVYGISTTVGYIKIADPTSPTLLAELGGRLAISFDTTLLALIQSSILVYLMKNVEAKDEEVLNSSAETVISQFINKLT